MSLKAIFKNLSVLVLSFTVANLSLAQDGEGQTLQAKQFFTKDSLISDVIADPAFAGFGRLLFPTNPRFYSGNTLGELDLTWYNNINPQKTVEIVNYLKEKSLAGEKVREVLEIEFGLGGGFALEKVDDHVFVGHVSLLSRRRVMRRRG